MKQVFDTSKGNVEFDKSYLRNGEKVEGFFFIVYLGLRIRFKVLKVLKYHNILRKVSC